MFAFLGALFYLCIILFIGAREERWIREGFAIGISFFIGVELLYWIPMLICDSIYDSSYEAEKMAMFIFLGFASAIAIISTIVYNVRKHRKINKNKKM